MSPDGETRKIKHLRVFFVTAAWSIFAYIWLYMIPWLSSLSGVVQVWESLLLSSSFSVCPSGLGGRSRLLFYKYMHKKYTQINTEESS